MLFSLYATMHFSDRGVMRWALPPMTCEEGFAPPEQYNAIDHFCPQIDIYALASMVVFCLSGNILPDSRKLTEEMVRETLPPTIPETIVSALLNALYPRPKVSVLQRSLSSVRSLGHSSDLLFRKRAHSLMRCLRIKRLLDGLNICVVFVQSRGFFVSL